jgi:hypothetical protein
MYTVNHYFYDTFGALRSGRWTQRKYKSERVAISKANSVRGGYVCKLGSNDIHRMGEWKL